MKYVLMFFLISFFHYIVFAVAAEPHNLHLQKPFEETNLGKAIQDGNVENYRKALKELKVFNMTIEELSEKKTSKGKTIYQMLLEAPKEKNFFYNEFTSLMLSRIHLDIEKQQKEFIPETMVVILDRHIILLEDLKSKTEKQTQGKEDILGFLSRRIQTLETVKKGTHNEIEKVITKFQEDFQKLKEMDIYEKEELRQQLKENTPQEITKFREKLENEGREVSKYEFNVLYDYLTKYSYKEIDRRFKHAGRSIRSSIYMIMMISMGYHLLPETSVKDLLSIEGISNLKSTLLEATKYAYDVSQPLIHDKKVQAAASVVAAAGFAARALGNLKSLRNCRKSFSKPKPLK